MAAAETEAGTSLCCMSDIHQTKAYADFLAEIGWQVVVLSCGSRVYLKRLLWFSMLKVQRADVVQMSVEELLSVARRYWSVWVTVEFLSDQDFAISMFEAAGFSVSHSPRIETKTIVIDLMLQDKVLSSNMRRGHRYNLMRAYRRGLTSTVVSFQQLLTNPSLSSEVSALLAQNNRRIGMLPFSLSHWDAKLRTFLDSGFVVLIHDKSADLVAASCFMCSSTHAVYDFNGSTVEGRKLAAPTLAIWEGIIEAKQRNLALLDFGGIYDERFPRENWKGFTRFKQGFGGKTVVYPPMYSIFLWRHFIGSS